MIKNEDIICYSFSDWDKELVSNRYQILTRFAKNNRVFLFERPIYSSWDDRHRWKNIFRPVRQKNGLYIIAIMTTVNPEMNKQIYHNYTQKLISSFIINKPIMWFYDFNLSYMIDYINYKISCYHCTEDYADASRIYSDNTYVDQIRKSENTMIEKVNLIFTVSQNITRRIKHLNPNTFTIANAVDYDLYKKAQESQTNEYGLKPVLGYFGNLSDKVNFELLYELAKKLSSCQFIFGGPITSQSEFLMRLKKMSNVKVLPRMPVEKLPSIYREFDVCLIPYIQDEWFVKAAQPLKLYEYMASGKPIVSTRMDCLKNLQDVVYETKTIQEFIAKTKIALKEKKPEIRQKRITLAKINTWDNRFKLINIKIEEQLNKKLHQ